MALGQHEQALDMFERLFTPLSGARRAAAILRKQNALEVVGIEHAARDDIFIVFAKSVEEPARGLRVDLFSRLDQHPRRRHPSCLPLGRPFPRHTALREKADREAVAPIAVLGHVVEKPVRLDERVAQRNMEVSEDDRGRDRRARSAGERVAVGFAQVERRWQGAFERHEREHIVAAGVDGIAAAPADGRLDPG